MGDAPGMKGWWQASDGKWYPPESHPANRPPPPPSQGPAAPPPARPTARGTVWKVALGVVLGIFVVAIACTALLGSAAKKVSDDASKPAQLAVTTSDPQLCWSVTLTGDAGQSQTDHCGTKTLEMPSGLGANAVLQKKDPGGTLTAALVVDGKETKRQTTNADYGIVTLGR